MINSMTGFGKGSAEDSSCKVSVEIKTVNNRYLDLSIRMPRQLNPFESGIRDLIKQYVIRGKADVLIACEFAEGTDIEIKYNSSVASEYVKCLRQMAEDYGLRNELSVGLIAKMPDVFNTQQTLPDEESMKKLLEEAMTQALIRLNEARGREGAFLSDDIENKLLDIRTHVGFIKEKVPEINKAYEEKIRERMRSLLEDKAVDESRLLTEAAIFADRSAVDEEIVRLLSHLDAFSKTLNGERDANDGVGRKLDFIVQEMNRETNTILSKSTDMEVSGHAVDIKTTVEKIREQIQNLE